ncbi:MAG: heme exporter protein CcmD [Gammaproteobacteria bacterium RIFOXYA12_FULL_61_12]|nr:MAG: heme exporter protein CcmD [Gammaproteobacteria bacterium RIFOXYD12_FULL_61_37]OGT92747.1 MAG: heme exporter protein CcmD [Gammaproteobacteria bacterium RIFOXYA12_FULL_61_12]
MGGYALYVWGSFGMTALLMLAEPLLLRARHREILRRVARIARMNNEERT